MRKELRDSLIMFGLRIGLIVTSIVVFHSTLTLFNIQTSPMVNALVGGALGLFWIVYFLRYTPEVRIVHQGSIVELRIWKVIRFKVPRLDDQSQKSFDFSNENLYVINTAALWYWNRII